MYDIHAQPSSRPNYQLGAIGAYIELLDGMTSLRPFSQSAKLFEIVNGRLESEAPEISAVNPACLESMIKVVISGYVRICAQLIADGISMRTAAPTPADKYLAQETYLLQCLSPRLAARVAHYFSTLRFIQDANELKDLSADVLRELFMFESSMDPRPVNDFSPDAHQTILNQTESALDSLMRAGSYSDYLLPMLRVYHAVAKILVGDRSSPRDLKLGTLPHDVRMIRLSDSTAAVLPAPCTDMLRAFPEPDAAVISTRALRYVAAVEASEMYAE